MAVSIYDCEQARRKMDFMPTRIAANDVEANPFESHLVFCASCAAEFDARRRLKSLVKRAVRNTPPAPASLHLSIKNLIISEDYR